MYVQSNPLIFPKLIQATGEHADARELASLYLQNGVPIYPAPHGHAIHTLAWRMGLEMKAMQTDDDDANSSDANNNTSASNSNNSNSNKESSIDPFYTSRYPEEPEEHLPLRPSYTYVEEKSLFWKTKRGFPTEETPPPPPQVRPSSARGRRRGTVDGIPLGAAAAIRYALRENHGEDEPAFRPLRRSSFSSSSATGYTTVSSSPTSPTTPVKSVQPEVPKMMLRIHRHLADQHLFNLPSLRGEIEVGPMNIDADFFHPHIENSLRMRQKNAVPSNSNARDMDETIRRGGENANDVLSLWEDALEEGFVWDNDNIINAGLGLDGGGIALHPRRGVGSSRHTRENIASGAWGDASYTSPASNVSLQMYSLSSPNLSDDKKDILARIRVRVAAHQRKLESCIASVPDFHNALLDWWDELLPISAGIHFYNQQSPVPRMTHLQSFLTSPCPKAIGVVQCEIERVKTSNKKKLFPTYEYRLFIRDVKNDNPDNEPGLPPRKDSVLLVAKNKLRRRGVKSSVSSNTSSNDLKRGVTNYYICLPQQRDVDSHYRNANKSHGLPAGEKSGLNAAPVGTNPILGRVQGNFIGTEFQIFVPASGRKANSSSSSSGDESTPTAAGARRASVDTPIARSKNGLARLARRASLTMQRRPSISSFRRQSMDPASSDEDHKNKAYRRLSFTKSNRTKRSAIANSDYDLYSREVPAVEEEEIGAITYTANLLGNRPRVMDVCVPKLDENGSPMHVWRRASDNDVEDGEAGTNSRMLNQFKALQHARNAGEQIDADGLVQNDQNVPADVDDHGLMVLQNRPPWWNAEIQAFVLNFGGRVSVASVKNFQLCERTNQDHIMLQFGRISGRHSFTMDFQYPLTPMQAFAIAISSLQGKLSFG